MATYAALVSLFNDLQLIPTHLIHSFSFDDEQISSLSQTVEFLIDFMESYDSHGCTREATEALESRIATAAHAAHDVIQSHVVNQIHAGSTRRGKVRSYFLMDLQKAMDNMEFVKRKTMQLIKARSGSKPEQPTYSSKATTSSEPLKNAMVGFDEVVLRLLGILTGEPSDQRLVIPIAGMGGLGKTSLAKTVYEHSSLEHHFDVRLWATISQQYSAQSILTELLKISTTGGGNDNVSELGEELRKDKLWNRRYLIVLDDMWSLEAWNEVQMYLPDNGNGSRVVVTTRLSDLAAHLSSSPFKLNFLDEDKSWELFCGKTFGEEDCPVELEEIGKKIVKRCRGLPLTIVVIGGHLRKSSWTIEYWEKVAGYMDPISSIGEEEPCLEILSLSYQYLPAHLKPCFLYLAIFKEDEEFDATRLLQYWVAEGFLKPKEGLSLEEVGEDCLKDLVDRNLIIFVREEHSWSGKDKYYKIHDTMRELCLKACKKEKFLCVVEDSTQATIHRERRLMNMEREKFNSEMIGAKQSAPPLYSLVNKGGRDSFLSELLVDCKLLRVLVHEDKDADDLSSTCLPLSHVHQVNLRALAFNNWLSAKTAYSILSSISAACWNLQTLRMVMFDLEPIILPYEIWEMPQLRHILIRWVFLPDPACCPGSTQQECIVLQNLYTLGLVVNLRLTEEVCKRMPNLKELSLRYGHLCDDYCFHNLGRFNKLKFLWIAFDINSTWRDVLQSLTFPTSLEVLCLTDSHLRWEDLTIMISSLPLLDYLHVWLVSGSKWDLDKDKDEFCSLRILEIYNCDDLIYLNANPANIPVLETLYLYNLPKLSEIPLDIGEIPTLRLIELTDCSTSAAVSAMIMVIEQETSGNSDLQLYVYFGKDNREEFERFQETLQAECLTSNSLHLYYVYEKIKTV